MKYLPLDVMHKNQSINHDSEYRRSWLILSMLFRPFGFIAQNFSFICMFCWSLFVLLYFFCWPLCCLFFDIRIMIAPLVSSNSSLNYLAFQSFDVERIWWGLFQKCVAHTEFDMYLFIVLIQWNMCNPNSL